MEGLVFLVGIIGNIISLLMFLSPGYYIHYIHSNTNTLHTCIISVDHSPQNFYDNLNYYCRRTFVRIVKNKSTQEFESFPYICTLLSSSLWTYYGLTKPDTFLVATVNGFGVAVEIIYVSLFLFFAPPPIRVKTGVLFGMMNVGFLGAAVWMTHMLLDGEVRIDAIGLMCSALNIIMYASPLSAMKRVVRAKSVEYMPFLLSFFLFLNGGVWTFYAVLVRDWFLGVPNAIGFGLGTVQLVVYVIYMNPKPSKHLAADFVERSWQKEPLLLLPSSAHC